MILDCHLAKFGIATSLLTLKSLRMYGKGNIGVYFILITSRNHIIYYIETSSSIHNYFKNTTLYTCVQKIWNTEACNRPESETFNKMTFAWCKNH